MSTKNHDEQRTFWQDLPEKRCGKCKEMKLLTEFYTLKKTGKPQSKCKECQIQDRRRRHKEGYWKAYYAREETKRRYRGGMLRRNHGITIEEYDEMERSQGGRCAICGRSEPLKTRHGTDARMSVDHDHDTGKIRGLLCQHCNLALGKFKDDPGILRKALAYLAAHGKR